MKDTNDLFLRASRAELRFNTSRGSAVVDDLWKLSLESLDRLAVAYNEALQGPAQKSFISSKKKDKETEGLQLAFDVVKFVIDTKVAEAAEARAAAHKENERQFLKDLLARKQTANLEALTEDEITARLAALDA